MAKKNSQSLVDALKMLLISRKASTQEDVCVALEKQGYEINQSKASRLLRKTGAIKVINTKGETVYSLPREPAPPSMNTPLKELINEKNKKVRKMVLFAIELSLIKEMDVRIP